jgi:hypothetical protein
MDNAAEDIGNRTVVLSGNWYRLIPSRFPTIELYERIATPDQSAVLKQIETLTNPRVREKEALTRGTDITVETSPKLQNWNHAPFTYRNPMGSRYLNEHFGALELFESLQAALAVAIRKREAFLSATGQPRIELDMRVLRHDFSGEFVDRRADAVDMPQAERWKIGEELVKAGAHGVYYRCPELPHWFAVSIFDNDGLGLARQAEHYRFVWDGTRINAIYDYRSDSDGMPIHPEQIFAPAPI